jgi:hypothetical protein
VKVRPWLGLVVVASLALVLAGGTDAGAAVPKRPVKGAEYVTAVGGFEVDVLAELRVSPSGRSFRPSVSVVQVAQHICNGVRFHVGTVRHPVPISKDGHFEYRPRGGRGIVLRGRFTTRERARIDVRFMPAGERLPLSCGETAHAATVLERVRRYPFRDCRAHPEKSALGTSSGRVFEVWRYIDHVWTRVVFACLFSDDRQVLLDQRPYTTDDAGFREYRMAGPFVAWSQFQCGAACTDWWTLADLRDGERHILNLPVDTTSDLELKENGAFALIGSFIYRPETREVWASDTQGLRRLDQGNIDPRSLELSGSTLTWTKDGAKRSAQLD